MTWDCEAYGSKGQYVGALCFVAGESGVRYCNDRAECHTLMAAERQRVFQRIQEGAAAGDEDMQFLAEEFTAPEQLLGGEPDATGP